MNGLKPPEGVIMLLIAEAHYDYESDRYRPTVSLATSDGLYFPHSINLLWMGHGELYKRAEDARLTAVAKTTEVLAKLFESE